ncbi:MAG: hypothetical protein FWH02_06910 [Oscillospiraceae bacterium]|nr:hypothetical protein [Oscillospiraceae bacterium]
MKGLIDKILRNPISFEVLSVFVYAFYCVVFSVASIPSFLLIRRGAWLLGGGAVSMFLFILICFLGFYVFLISSAVVAGFAERLLTRGLAPGAYPVGSPVFFRWLVYSGLHLWVVNLVLAFIRGNNWIKIYLRAAGAKVGKEVFVNTKDLYDAYLLEVEDNVIIGGEAFVNCHLFENGSLILGKITLGEGTVVGANAYLTPGTHTGRNSRVGMYTYLRRDTKIPDGRALITPPGMSLRRAVRLMKEEESKVAK